MTSYVNILVSIKDTYIECYLDNFRTNYNQTYALDIQLQKIEVINSKGIEEKYKLTIINNKELTFTIFQTYVNSLIDYLMENYVKGSVIQLEIIDTPRIQILEFSK